MIHHWASLRPVEEDPLKCTEYKVPMYVVAIELCIDVSFLFIAGIGQCGGMMSSLRFYPIVQIEIVGSVRHCLIFIIAAWDLHEIQDRTSTTGQCFV